MNIETYRNSIKAAKYELAAIDKTLDWLNSDGPTLSDWARTIEELAQRQRMMLKRQIDHWEKTVRERTEAGAGS